MTPYELSLTVMKRMYKFLRPVPGVLTRKFNERPDSIDHHRLHPEPGGALRKSPSPERVPGSSPSRLKITKLDPCDRPTTAEELLADPWFSEQSVARHAGSASWDLIRFPLIQPVRGELVPGLWVLALEAFYSALALVLCIIRKRRF